MSILQKTNIAVDISNGEKVISYLRRTETYLKDVLSRSKVGESKNKLNSCLKSLKMALGNYEYIWGSLARSECNVDLLEMEVASLKAKLIISEKQLLIANEKFEALKSEL